MTVRPGTDFTLCRVFFALSVVASEIHCNQYGVHDILNGRKLSIWQALQTLHQHVYISRSPVHIITGAKQNSIR